MACLALTPRLVHESRVDAARRHYDAAGAVSITSSLILLVFAVSKAPQVGWGTGRTIGLLAGSAALLVAFLLIETRVEQPLMPFGIFRLRVLAGANVVGFLLGGTIFGSFFLLTQYMQVILHYSALQAGVAFLATAGTSVIAAGVAQALVTRLGVMKVLAVGMALIAAGQLLYTRFPVHAGYTVDLLPGFLATGVGIAFAFVPVSIAALAGVSHDEAGLASGLINTSLQVGGALGLTILVTLSSERTNHLLAHGVGRLSALTQGFSLGYWVAFAIALVALGTTLVVMRRDELEHAEHEPAAASAS